MHDIMKVMQSLFQSVKFTQQRTQWGECSWRQAVVEQSGEKDCTRIKKKKNITSKIFSSVWCG